MSDEHRDARAVLARVEDLLGLVVRRIEAQLRLAEDGARARIEIVAVDGARHREAGEQVERLPVARRPPKPPAVPRPGSATLRTGCPSSANTRTSLWASCR